VSSKCWTGKTKQSNRDWLCWCLSRVSSCVGEKRNFAINHARQKHEKNRNKTGEGLVFPVVNFSLSAWLPAEQRAPWWPARRAMRYRNLNITITCLYTVTQAGGPLGVLSLAHKLPQDYGKERVISHSLHGLPEGSHAVSINLIAITIWLKQLNWNQDQKPKTIT
jgi:hypothetical protein